MIRAAFALLAVAVVAARALRALGRHVEGWR